MDGPSSSFIQNSNRDTITNTSHGFNILFFQRILKLSKVMFPSWKSVTVLLFGTLLLVALLEQVVIYNVGLIPSRYYKVLGDKDAKGFQSVTLFSLLIVVSVAFIKSTVQFICRILYINWRKFLDQYIHKLYFKGVLYYDVNVLDKEVDNPDQRITQDVDKMCNQLSLIIAQLIITPFTMAYYFYQCAKTTGYLGPVSVIVFFLISTIINKFLMTPVVQYVFKQENLEGDFRFKHMQMRVNAESAAFLRAGNIEEIKTNHTLNQLILTQQKLYMREYALNFSVNMANYLGSILSYLVLGIPILSGVYDSLSGADLSSLISKNSFVIMYLINCFTRLIDMAVKVTEIAGTTHRVAQLIEKLKDLEDEQSRNDSEFDSGDFNNVIPRSNTSVENIAVAFDVEHVSYGAPKAETPLLRDLTLKVVTGTNILVTGGSGCGKSSLFRILDGLWQPITGKIKSTLTVGAMFLPQKPFLTNGTLREQIMYPLTPNRNQGYTLSDAEIFAYIKSMNLQSLLERIGGLDTTVEWNWYDMLSPGEMQRLSFIRLFYHKPVFALLDEATSQVDMAAEHHLYTTCHKLGITLVSIGHRDTLREFHDQELHLDGTGNYEIRDIIQTRL